MALRWTATGFLEGEKSFRRVHVVNDLRMLRPLSDEWSLPLTSARRLLNLISGRSRNLQIRIWNTTGGTMQQLVTKMKQVQDNIAELERGRKAKPGSTLRTEYESLIRRGKCFVPYKLGPKIAFAPSRFTGYVGNKLSTHASNPYRAGGLTNVALTKIIDSPPRPNKNLENRYIRFCEDTDLTLSNIKRNYWIPPEIADLLDEEAEEKSLASIDNNPKLSDTEREQLIQARRGQGLFRDRLLDYWKKCCVTSCDLQMVLRASHIKPWRQSSNEERLDKFNGLLLTPNVDALFDKGLISFSDSGEMLLSPQVSRKMLQVLIGKTEARIKVKVEHKKYLKYHRNLHRFGR